MGRREGGEESGELGPFVDGLAHMATSIPISLPALKIRFRV